MKIKQSTITKTERYPYQLWVGGVVGVTSLKYYYLHYNGNLDNMIEDNIITLQEFIILLSYKINIKDHYLSKDGLLYT